MSRPTDSADRYSDAQWERRENLIARDERSENEEASKPDEDEEENPLLLVLPLNEDTDSDGSTMRLSDYFERYEDHTGQEEAAIRGLKVGGELRFDLRRGVSYDSKWSYSIRRLS